MSGVLHGNFAWRHVIQSVTHIQSATHIIPYPTVPADPLEGFDKGSAWWAWGERMFGPALDEEEALARWPSGVSPP